MLETLPRSMHDFWEQLCCALSERISFEVFSPIWSHVNETKKKKNRKKTQKYKISKKNALEMR